MEGPGDDHVCAVWWIGYSILFTNDYSPSTRQVEVRMRKIVFAIILVYVGLTLLAGMAEASVYHVGERTEVNRDDIHLTDLIIEKEVPPELLGVKIARTPPPGRRASNPPRVPRVASSIAR